MTRLVADTMSAGSWGVYDYQFGKCSIEPHNHILAYARLQITLLLSSDLYISGFLGLDDIRGAMIYVAILFDSWLLTQLTPGSYDFQFGRYYSDSDILALAWLRLGVK